MNIYKEYEKLKLDKSYIGLEEGDTEGGYFCTPIEQIISLSKEEFEDFIVSEDNTILPEQQEVLNNLQEKLDLIPFETPYEYVKELQSKFDYSKIKFTGENLNVIMTFTMCMISAFRILYLSHIKKNIIKNNN